MSIKKQIYILSIISILYSIKANAQVSIGVDAGITYNKLDYKINNSNLSLENEKGYIANINIDYRLNKWFSLEGSPGVIQKNYSIKNKNNIYQQTNNTYLQLPVSIKYDIKIIKRLTASASLGVYYAYWITSNIEGIAPNVFELSNNADGDELVKLQNIKYAYQFDAKKDNRSEFGWVAKAGLNYKIINNLEGLIKAHYYQSITDQQKKVVDMQIARYNQTFAVTAGLAYHF